MSAESNGILLIFSAEGAKKFSPSAMHDPELEAFIKVG